MRYFIPLLASLALSGCAATFDYDDLKGLSLKKDDFAAALAREYREFAVFEHDDMADFRDAARFKRKALLAAMGQNPPPERLDAWSVPSDHIKDVTLARHRLHTALKSGARDSHPKIAARAQAGFDCWLEQLDENFQPGDIAHCRRAFTAALDYLEANGGTSPKAGLGGSGNIHPANASAPLAAAPRQSRAYVVFFGFDDIHLTDAELETLDAVKAAATGSDQVFLRLDGHADRAGPDPYNRRLALQRAAAVRQALIERGLAPERITTHSFGETRPRVVTPDGLRHSRNRRVEVTIAPSVGM